MGLDGGSGSREWVEGASRAVRVAVVCRHVGRGRPRAQAGEALFHLYTRRVITLHVHATSSRADSPASG